MSSSTCIGCYNLIVSIFKTCRQIDVTFPILDCYFPPLDY
nr:MAG TPA: hypothetical protein [Caudoviricetes sp.]DAO41487.1 MAG TPA: hypothetical protein [Bacteriophage sp.]